MCNKTAGLEMLIYLKMPFFYIISHFILFVKWGSVTFGKNVGTPVGPRSLEKIAYGTRSGDSDLSDHFREKHAANNQTKQPYKNRIWRSARKNGP